MWNDKRLLWSLALVFALNVLLILTVQDLAGAAGATKELQNPEGPCIMDPSGR